MAINPRAGSLIFGRTVGNENIPVRVNSDGTLDVSVSAGGSTIADGADVTQGAIADVKVTGDNSGTASAKLRGFNYLWSLVIDTVNSWVKVSIQNASLAVTGDVAHDAADSGNPVKIGGKAASADPTAVANADRVNALFDLIGRLVSAPYCIPENTVSGAITTAMTGTTSTSLVAAPGAGLRNYITTLIISNAHASVGTDVVIQDGSGGTTLLTIPAAAVYGGAVINLPVPLRQPTANTALFCANTTTGASTKVSAVGYKGV